MTRARQFGLYGQLKHEYGSKGIQPVLKQADPLLDAVVGKTVRFAYVE